MDLLLQGLCDSQPKWLLQEGQLYDKAPRTISLLKLGFHISGKSQGIRYFSFS